MDSASKKLEEQIKCSRERERVCVHIKRLEGMLLEERRLKVKVKNGNEAKASADKPSCNTTMIVVDNHGKNISKLPFSVAKPGQTEVDRNRPNKNKKQPIKIQTFREMHNIPPDVYLSCNDGIKAYVGNVEFLLPTVPITREDKVVYGCYNTKPDAVREIQKTRKGSRERRALIKFMVEGGLVPCGESSLYTQVQMAAKHGLDSLRYYKPIDKNCGIRDGYGWGRQRTITRKKAIEVESITTQSGHTYLKVGDIIFSTPENGKVYSKREALYWIAKTLKGSAERGAMIRFMVQNGYVLCNIKCLYDLVRSTEVDRDPVGSDNWGKRGHPTDEDIEQKQIASEKLDSGVIRFDNKIFGRGRKGSNKLQSIRELSVEENSKGDGSISAIRDSIMSRNGWKDHLVLQLIPVRFYDDLEELFNVPYMGHKVQNIDVCFYIGHHVNHPDYNPARRVYRLYFPSNEMNDDNFPPPTNLNDGGNSIEFAKLKRNIMKKSHVFCNGGSKNERVFTCDRNYKNGQHGPSCPFGFTVRWDKYGFYIHLLSNVNTFTNRGCPWHCCSGTNT